eukprot:Skav212297  [mRNA]  locus=scaffold732:628111:628914:- [translate_table: standard]
MSFTEEQKAEIKEAFDLFDTDGTGTIEAGKRSTKPSLTSGSHRGSESAAGEGAQGGVEGLGIRTQKGGAEKDGVPWLKALAQGLGSRSWSVATPWCPPRSDLDKSGSSHGQGMLDFNEFLEIMTATWQGA